MSSNVDTEVLREIVDRYSDNTNTLNAALRSLLHELNELIPNPTVTREAVITLTSDMSEEDFRDWLGYIESHLLTTIDPNVSDDSILLRIRSIS